MDRWKERSGELILITYCFAEECAPSGKYVTLINHSKSKDIDISRWTLKRRVDSTSEILYTLPREIRLPSGRELFIYASSEANAIQSTQTIVSTKSHDEIVCDSVASWGM